MIEFYNQIKGRVDTLYQMCPLASSNRKTQRWPLCNCDRMFNIAFINNLCSWYYTG